MLDLMRFEQLRRWIELCGSAAVPDRHNAAKLPAVPTRTVRGSLTCACGRYNFVRTCMLRWAVNPSVGTLEACGVVEFLGPVTSAELQRWERGLQTLCSDDACLTFAQCGGMRAPNDSPHTDPELSVREVSG